MERGIRALVFQLERLGGSKVEVIAGWPRNRTGKGNHNGPNLFSRNWIQTVETVFRNQNRNRAPPLKL